MVSVPNSNNNNNNNTHVICQVLPSKWEQNKIKNFFFFADIVLNWYVLKLSVVAFCCKFNSTHPKKKQHWLTDRQTFFCVQHKNFQSLCSVCETSALFFWKIKSELIVMHLLSTQVVVMLVPSNHHDNTEKIWRDSAGGCPSVRLSARLGYKITTAKNSFFSDYTKR